MFIEEAHWIRSRLAAASLPPGARVLDLGSSTLRYRTVLQPHITELVHEPLRGRGCRLTCADIKDGDGIDLVIDLSRKDLPDAVFARPYDLVICSNILEHVADRATFMRNVLRFCASPGLLLCTVPRTFPYHADPIDTMYRPSAAQLAAFIGQTANVAVQDEDVVGIDDPSYYEFTPGRILDHLLLRSLRMRVRGSIPLLHWKVSCVLLRTLGLRPE